MTPQELKNSILQLAIQGKLVEQRPEEGTAEELYKKIQAEKQKLIKAGKIKKEKPLPEITEDEVPFEIPESWKWVRLSDVIDVRDGTHYSPKYVLNGIPLVTSKNLSKGYIDFENTNQISPEDAESINLRSAVNDGDILFAMIGTIGNPIMVKKDREFCIKNTALFKTFHKKLFYMSYLLIFLQHEQHLMKKRATGGVQAFVSLRFLREYLLPLPPLAEQKRIVAKIEELLPLADRYGEAWDRLEELNKRFPDDMRKSVLQLAIQGKLVEQRPEEGTAEELYKKIQAEKQKLIKAGKIKKEKPLPGITEDEIPFEIPSSWLWIRIGDIASLVTKGTTPRGGNVCYSDSGVGFLRAENVAGYDRLDKTNLKYVDQKTHTNYLKRSIIEENDVLITIAGTLGRTAIARRLDLPLNANQAVSIIRIAVLNSIHLLYIIYALNAHATQKRLVIQRKITAIPNLTLEIIENCIIPLPPLAEQKRIVAKIEEILPLCEKLR